MEDREGPQSWYETRARWNDPSIPEPDPDANAYPRPKSVTLDPRDCPGDRPRETDSLVPQGVPTTFPPRGLREVPSRPSEIRTGAGVPPGVVFQPDDRRAFRDRSFPWGAVGRVDTPVGKGTGFVVGPRHLMTASHVLEWSREGVPGWVRFRAGYNQSFPDSGLGELWTVESFAEVTYSYKKLDGNVASLDQKDIGWDYVVCVMDRRIGEEVGWLGTKTYDTDWDDIDVWQNVGYPKDAGNLEFPVFQRRPFRVLDEYDGSDVDDAVLLRAEGDFSAGQSGSPVFASFASGIKAVGLWAGGGTYPSLSDDQGNFCPGGPDFVRMVNTARTDFP